MGGGRYILRASSRRAGLAPNNRRRHQGSASRPAQHRHDGARQTCYRGGNAKPLIFLHGISSQPCEKNVRLFNELCVLQFSGPPQVHICHNAPFWKMDHKFIFISVRILRSWEKTILIQQILLNVTYGFARDLVIKSKS